MKICEDCIKQDVCKFMEEPLTCQHKRTDTFTLYNPHCDANVTYPSWDTGDYPLAAEVTWC